MRGAHTWTNKLFLYVAVSTVCWLPPVVIAQTTPDVHLNEFIPNPIGDDSLLEFIELYNNSDVDADVSNWVIDTGGSARFSIDAGTIIPAKGYIVFFSAQKAIALTNSGDRIKLLLADGTTIQDDVPYSSSKEGYSYNRVEGGLYQQSSTPTPGSENRLDVSPTPTPTITPTPTPTPTMSTTPTGTISPTPLPVYSDTIKINEFLPNPAGDDTKLEFIELFNTGTDVVDLSGWVLDDVAGDGSAPYTIPSDTTVGPAEYVVFYSLQTKISLNNDSDHVRLLDPEGGTRDEVTYASSKEGYSYNRVPETDFQESIRTTPGEENIIDNPTPTPKPTATPSPTSVPHRYDYSTHIIINELFPYPKKGSQEDEFVELKNTENRTILLYGWSIDDGEKGSSPYRFKETDVLPPRAFLVLRKIDTHIAFNNDHDSARLIDPSEKVVASLEYTKPGIEQSLSRTPEDSYAWTEILTPGKENIISVHNETVSPKPKKTARVSRAKSPRVAGVVRTQNENNAPSLLPWASLSGPSVTIQSVVGGVSAHGVGNARKNIFAFFGISVASWRALSGISHKEKIWRWKK